LEKKIFKKTKPNQTKQTTKLNQTKPNKKKKILKQQNQVFIHIIMF